MFDLQGAKIRLAGGAPRIDLEVGATVQIATDHIGDVGDCIELPIDFAGLEKLVDERSEVVIGDTCDGQMWRKSTLYNWVLKPRGIQLWFDKYEVSAGYCGAVSITVPWRDSRLRALGQRVATQVRNP